MTQQTFSKLCESSICPVCGFQLDFQPWVGDAASHEICPSCGIHFGYDDFAAGDLSRRVEVYSDWRHRWLDSGMTWWSKRKAPDDWNPKIQIERIRDVA